MKSKLIFLVLMVMVSFSLKAQSNFQENDLSGSWLGKLKVQGFELRLIFHLSVDESGKMKASLDSPDQGAFGIGLGEVSFKEGKIKINAPSLMAYYEGILIQADSMSGTWSQGGQSFDLPVKKQLKEIVINRPQEPKAPFPYQTEEVQFKNEKEGHQISATLTIPEGNGKFPAVILISGSGAQNRDEELFGHKPFWVIADYLTRQGIAVLRYDDQGVGKSEGSQLNTTSFDYSFDAEAAFNFLKSDSRINNKAIGFAGHSEGGLIAPILISRNNEVGFFISMAGPSIRGKELLIIQSRALLEASGKNETEIAEDQEWTLKMFEIIMNENDNDEAQKQITDNYGIYLKSEGKSDEEIEKEVQTLNRSFPKVAYNWMRYFLKTDPDEFLSRISCPVLVLNGDKDLQVISGENLNTYEKIFKNSGLKDYQLIELKDHNHLFQHCTTGLPSEYGQIEETFSTEALEIITKWIKERF